MIRAAPALLALAGCGTSRTADILALEGDPWAGESVYAARCASCHGANGAGGTGPALTAPDDEETFVDVVLDGTGTMSGVGDVVTDEEVADLLAYAAEGYVNEDVCRSSTGCG